MSRHEVLVRHITVTSHPNADALELGQIDDYYVVVQKGLYQTGDLVAYIPEGSLLPDSITEEMGLTGRLGSQNRVKAVRLRGELSQGIVYPARPEWVEGQDVAAVLGITKWEPSETPAVPGGKPASTGHHVHLGNSFTVDYDIENVKKWGRAVLTEGERVVLTEKVHGTFAQFLMVPRGMIPIGGDYLPPGWGWDHAAAPEGFRADSTQDGHHSWTTTKEGTIESAWSMFRGKRWYHAVSSKGVGARGYVLKLGDPIADRSLYARAARHFNMFERMEAVFGTNDVPVVICAELFGRGMQDLPYGADVGTDETIGLRVFDIRVGTRENGRWLNDGPTRHLDTGEEVASEFEAACAALALPRVPVLYRGPYSREVLEAHTTGRETISGKELHLREGVVARPEIERTHHRLGRVILKSVSADYLTRKGGTEYN